MSAEPRIFLSLFTTCRSIPAAPGDAQEDAAPIVTILAGLARALVP